METVLDQLADLPFVPKWLGYPMHPGGFPVHAENVTITTEGEPRSIQQRIEEYYQVCINDDGELVASPPLSEDDFQVLRQWVIYYLHAPIWHQADFAEFEALKTRSFAIASWADLSDICHQALDFGLDILS